MLAEQQEQQAEAADSLSEAKLEQQTNLAGAE
jgi:hypothetical protein